MLNNLKKNDNIIHFWTCIELLFETPTYINKVIRTVIYYTGIRW